MALTVVPLSNAVEAMVYGTAILWVLDYFGITDVLPIYEWIEKTAPIFEWVRWPIDYVKEISLEFTYSENFTPSNEGFLFYFNFIVYPLLYTLLNNICPITILNMTVLVPIYTIMPELFIDEELTKENPKGDKIPMRGLPMFLAEMYSIMALLWGDYDYLIDENYLTISGDTLRNMLLWSWIQLFFSALFYPFMLVWSFFSVQGLIAISLYDKLVLKY